MAVKPYHPRATTSRLAWSVPNFLMTAHGTANQAWRPCHRLAPCIQRLTRSMVPLADGKPVGGVPQDPADLAGGGRAGMHRRLTAAGRPVAQRGGEVMGVEVAGGAADR